MGERTSQATLKAILFATAAALLWALVEGIGSQIAGTYHPLQIVWMRYAAHLAALILFVGLRYGLSFLRTARPGLQIARGSLMLLMPICFLAALAAAPVENVLGTFWIVPSLAMILAILLLRERVPAWAWLAMAIGWAGVLLIVRPHGTAGQGTLPALGMALCLALYLVMTSQLRYESTSTNLFYTAACVLVLLSFAMPRVWRTPTPGALVTMVAIGLLGLGFLYAIDRAAELAPISVVAVPLFTQPVWTLGLGRLFAGVHIGRAGMLGIALVATSLVTMIAFAAARVRRATPNPIPLVEGDGSGDIPLQPVVPSEQAPIRST